MPFRGNASPTLADTEEEAHSFIVTRHCEPTEALFRCMARECLRPGGKTSSGDHLGRSLLEREPLRLPVACCLSNYGTGDWSSFLLSSNLMDQIHPPINSIIPIF